MQKNNSIIKNALIFTLMLFTTLTFALTNNATADNTPVTNEIIVKFKGNAAQNLRSQLLSRAGTLSMTTVRTGTPLITSELDDILTAEGVISIKPLATGLYQRMRSTGKTAAELRLASATANNRMIRNNADMQSFTLEDVFVLTTKAGTGIDDLLDTLNSRADVAYAEPNMIMTIQLAPDDPYYSSKGSWGQDFDDLWGIKMIESEKAWAGSLGEGVLVAVVDTGINYNHEDIRDNMWINTGEIPDNNIDDDNNGYVDDVYGYDFNDGDNNPGDNVGHGTHCAGTIAGTANNGLGVIGVAPAAKVMAVRGLGPNGGSTANLAVAVTYAIENGADIISNSWGGQGNSPILKEVFDYADSLGILSIAAAGNSGMNTAQFTPANIDSVLAVSAINSDGGLASFSNYGAMVDVAAPGVDVLSCMSENTAIAIERPHLQVAPGYYRLSGTSMACPHTAGVAALLMSHFKKEDFNHYPSAIRTMITNAATPFLVPPHVPAGSGILNADRAFNVEEVPEVVCQGYEIVEVEGNGNGIIESHEKAALIITLKNKGLKAATGLRGEVSTNSRYIKSIVLDQVTFGTIEQGDTLKFSTQPFILEIDELPANSQKDRICADLTINVTTNEGYQTEIDLETLLGVRFVSNIATGNFGRISISDDYIAWLNRSGMSTEGIMVFDRNTGTTRRLEINGMIDRFIDLDGSTLLYCQAKNMTSNDYDLYSYDLKTDVTKVISNAPETQTYPRIDGDHIVWIDWRNGNGDIYMYTMSTGEEKQLTATDRNEFQPVIKGNTIIWKSGKKVCVYDIATGKLRELPLDYTTPSGGYSTEAISGNLIAYRFENGVGFGSPCDSYIYNLLTGENIKLTDMVGLPDTTGTQIIDIVDNTIIFSYLTKGIFYDSHYHAYNIDTGELSQLTGILGNFDMGVNKNEIVWFRSPDQTIYLSSINIHNNKEEVNLSLLPETRVYASSEFNAQFNKQNAVDGNESTVWGSAPVAQDSQPFIYVDLAKRYELTKIVIKFYKGYEPASLLLGVSNDLKKWTTATIAGKETVELDIGSLHLRSQYIGFQCLAGMSIAYGVKEFEVWGNRIKAPPTPIPTPTPAGVPVEISDAALEKVIRYCLNKASGTIYSSELENMQTLFGPNTGITDISPLTHCRNLQYINIENNPIGDISALARNTKVVDLYLNNCAITDISPLSGMNKLSDLYIENNAISDLTPLMGLESLYRLYANNNKVSDLSWVADTGPLGVLELDNNLIEDISPLADINSIFTYHLSGNKIKDISLFSQKPRGIFVLDVTYNNMVIKDDGGQGTLNIEAVTYLKNKATNVKYEEGNIIE